MKQHQAADVNPSFVPGNREMGLVLSAESKPRLKWTPELHQRFVNAVSQLGGINKATPKAVMKAMGVPKLTLFHLKSHLQKYRLKNQQLGIMDENTKAERPITAQGDTDVEGIQIYSKSVTKDDSQTKKGGQITEALQKQMEVQQTLHEQIEVQRHLQLRIEAQGKYLQSVLKAAQEMLAGCNISPIGLEAAKELSELVSLVDVQSPSSSHSELTVISDLCMQKEGTKLGGDRLFLHQTQPAECSMESCMTSPESPEMKDENLQRFHSYSARDVKQIETHAHKSMEINSKSIDLNIKHSSHWSSWGKRTSTSASSDDTEADRKFSQTIPHQDDSESHLKRLRFCGDIDLNSQYQSETDSEGHRLDLNCWI